jgi:hypothetical protein
VQEVANPSHRKEQTKVSRREAFEERARAEVERIKAEKAAEEERKQARMRELAKEARARREAEAEEERKRKAERDAKLRQTQEQDAKAEEERAKRAMFNSWIANGGSLGEFEDAWPNLKREMLTQRTLEREKGARESHRAASHSRI